MNSAQGVAAGQTVWYTHLAWISEDHTSDLPLAPASGFVMSGADRITAIFHSQDADYVNQ
jgi:hypothetical protein